MDGLRSMICNGKIFCKIASCCILNSRSCSRSCLLTIEGKYWKPRWEKQDLYWVLVTFAYIWKDIKERDKFQNKWADLLAEKEIIREI